MVILVKFNGILNAVKNELVRPGQAWPGRAGPGQHDACAQPTALATA